MRPRFRVVNPVKGIAEDASGIYFYFARTLDLQAGDIISAEVIDHNLLIDVFVEEGPSAGKERSEFESAGGPERDAVGIETPPRHSASNCWHSGLRQVQPLWARARWI